MDVLVMLRNDVILVKDILGPFKTGAETVFIKGAILSLYCQLSMSIHCDVVTTKKKYKTFLKYGPCSKHACF